MAASSFIQIIGRRKSQTQLSILSLRTHKISNLSLKHSQKMNLVLEIFSVLFGYVACMFYSPITEDLDWGQGFPSEASEKVWIHVIFLLAGFICSAWSLRLINLTIRHDARRWKKSVLEFIASMMGTSFGAVCGGTVWVQLNANRWCFMDQFHGYQHHCHCLEHHCDMQPFWIVKLQLRLLEETSEDYHGRIHPPPFYLYSSYRDFVARLPMDLLTAFLLLMAFLAKKMNTKRPIGITTDYKRGMEFDTLEEVGTSPSKAENAKKQDITVLLLQIMKGNTKSDSSERKINKKIELNIEGNQSSEPVFTKHFFYQTKSRTRGTNTCSKCDACGHCHDKDEARGQTDDNNAGEVELAKSDTEGMVLPASAINSEYLVKNENETFLKPTHRRSERIASQTKVTLEKAVTVKKLPPKKHQQKKTNRGEGRITVTLPECVTSHLLAFLKTSNKQKEETSQKLERRRSKRILNKQSNRAGKDSIVVKTSKLRAARKGEASCGLRKSSKKLNIPGDKHFGRVMRLITFYEKVAKEATAIEITRKKLGASKKKN